MIDRHTKETQIRLGLALDGRGRYTVRTGIRFLDHMLELFARHGAFDLTIDARGNVYWTDPASDNTGARST